MDDPLVFAEQTARKAGELLLEFFNPNGTRTRSKADQSVVTEADLASDRWIYAQIHENFPAETVLSEELHTELAGGSKTCPAVWVVDPLDGTTNFSLGLHYWGILIARLEDGFPSIAALYFPLLDEMYTAQKDMGARLNGQQMHTKPPERSQTASFFSCCSRTFQNYDVSVPYKTRILGSAAYTFCCVARGAAVLGFEATAKVWDIAGAWLVAAEAGATVETLDGSAAFPLSSGVNYSQRSFPCLVASAPRVAQRARQQILPRR